MQSFKKIIEVIYVNIMKMSINKPHIILNVDCKSSESLPLYKTYGSYYESKILNERIKTLKIRTDVLYVINCYNIADIIEFEDEN